MDDVFAEFDGNSWIKNIRLNFLTFSSNFFATVISNLKTVPNGSPKYWS